MTDEKAAQPRQIEISTPMQRHILAAVLTVPGCCARVRSVLDPLHFSDTKTSDIVAWVAKHWDDHKQVPSKAALYDVFRSTSDRMVIKRLFKEQVPDAAYTERRIIDFARNRAMRLAVVTAARIVDAEAKGEIPVDLNDRPYKKGQIPDPVKLVRDAMMVGQNISQMGEFLFEKEALEAGIEEILHPKNLDLFTSGMHHLDEAGLKIARGEVGCVLGATGKGKTHCLINTTIGNLKEGRNVLLVNVEMQPDRLRGRIFRRVAGSKVSMKDDPVSFVAKLRERLPKVTAGKLNILHLNARTHTVDDIRSHLQQLRSLGFETDVIVCDYVGVLKPPRGYDDKDERIQLAELWLHFRSLCREYNCAGWSGAQVNRDGSEDELVKGNKIGGSFAIISHLDALYTICMTDEEYDEGVGRFFNAKSRNEGGNQVIDFEFDFSRSLIRTTGIKAHVAKESRKKKTSTNPEDADDNAAYEAAIERRKKSRNN